MMEGQIEKLAQKIRPETRLTVLTGAGVSAASGVPTFRGPDGFWKKYRPEALATPEAFQRDPNSSGNGTTGGGRSWPRRSRIAPTRCWRRGAGDIQISRSSPRMSMDYTSAPDPPTSFDFTDPSGKCFAGTDVPPLPNGGGTNEFPFPRSLPGARIATG